MHMQNQPMLLTRPGTLAEVQRLVRHDGETMRFCLAAFLDQFYLDRDRASRYARIIDDPGVSGDERFDALMGAIGEHLSRRWQLGPPPGWTDHPARFLSRPWFMGPEQMKGFCSQRALPPTGGAYLHRGRAAAADQDAARRTLVGLRDHAHGPRAAAG
jgi:hypothetical protein